MQPRYICTPCIPTRRFPPDTIEKSKTTKTRNKPLAESGGNRHGKRATKLLYTRKLVGWGVVSLVSVARYTFDSLLPQVPSSEYYENYPKN